MTKILAYRFSAFGDIAMLVPVLKEFLDENPDTEILMVSRKNFKDLFDGIPRLKFKGVDLKEYEGFFGLKKLSNEILSEFQPDMVADFHNVLRSNILNFFFWLKRLPIHKIDKGRKEKKQLIDTKNRKICRCFEKNGIFINAFTSAQTSRGNKKRRRFRAFCTTFRENASVGNVF